MEETLEPIQDASHLYAVEGLAQHAERPGFRITELQLAPTQQVPWHQTASEQTLLVKSRRANLQRHGRDFLQGNGPGLSGLQISYVRPFLRAF
jgi:hypothetical protein